MAYGEPLQPNRTSFDIGIWDNQITISVIDLDEEDNDDVRDVVHPDFETYWGNDMENVFTTWHGMDDVCGRAVRSFSTMREAKDWCISIGMIYTGINENSETQDLDKVISPNDQYTLDDLRQQLKHAERNERYEKCAEILAEIKKREQFERCSKFLTEIEKGDVTKSKD